MSIAECDDARISAESPEDIASIFSSYFTSVFTRDPLNTEANSRTNDVLTNQDYSINTSLLDDVTLTSDYVAAVLWAFLIKIKLMVQIHGIPVRLLTETANQIAPSLCDLLNKSLRTGVVPRDWPMSFLLSKRGIRMR